MTPITIIPSRRMVVCHLNDWVQMHANAANEFRAMQASGPSPFGSTTVQIKVLKVSPKVPCFDLDLTEESAACTANSAQTISFRLRRIILEGRPVHIVEPSFAVYPYLPLKP